MKANLFFLIAFLFQLNVGQGQTSLTGSWELYNDGDPPGGGIFMTITHTGDIIRSSGPEWSGEGQFNTSNNQGSYNWTFTDGKIGTTSFTYLPEFDILDGYVGGSGISWNFLARRVSKPLGSFTGSYASNNGEMGILSLRQSSNQIDIFFKYPSYYVYGSGYVNGNFAMIEFAALYEFATDLTPSATGKIFLFISDDRQSVLLRSYQLTPSWAGPNGGTFTRLPSNAIYSAPAGWIGLDGAQSCFQEGSGGFRLSCQSPDDFEESGYCLDPRTLDLIDFWLSKARPFSNWEKAWYDCWGRWVGTSPNGETRGNCHRPDTGGRTRCEYLIEHLKDANPRIDYTLLGLTSYTDMEGYLIRKLTGK